MMKIEKQLPAATGLDPRPGAQPQVPMAPAKPRASEPRQVDTRPAEKLLSSGSGFNIQLNQQLSSMQSADRYLGELSEQLSALKLSISRQLASPQTPAERESILRSLQQVNTLLEQRSKRSGNSLDATLKVRLNEPLRSRFTLQGLDSVEKLQASGRETLIFTAGRALPEPAVVVLDDDMGVEQILRRFNSSLGIAGIRAELDQDGALQFSAPEQNWQQLKEQLKVRGEDKLFAKDGFTPLESFEEGFTGFSENLAKESARELRQLLDSVVAALDRVNTIRDQLNQRQDDVRDFLARQESANEKQWALQFASSVFNTEGRQGKYSVTAQTVLAQANLTRFAVVSLLS